MPLTPGTNKWEQITGSTCERCGGFCSHNFGRKILWTVLGIFLVYGVFYVGTLIRNNLKEYNYIGRAPRMERTVSVNGFGKVTGNNDIAQTTIGFSNTDRDIAKAQADNKKVMDQVYADLKKMGIAEKDLQANYSIYPEYNYTQERGQELKGYKVNNSLTIKIRDLNKISEVLGLAGKYGANEVSGLSFTIDDPENLKMEAKQKALADAKVKANALAQALGVRLGGVISYYESEVGGDYYAPKYDMATGMGGVMNMAAPAAVPSGSKDVAMNVTIIYEILP
jgi:uncharacterized protein YggE